MPRMTDEEFEAAVEEALESIPERFLEALENVAVVVEDEPDDYHFDILDEPVFKGPHERCFGSRAELVAEIGKTVVHEIGHYFGIDDARLREMGY